MSLISENVIPGPHGSVFMVDIPDRHEFERVRDKILKVEGVEDVLFNDQTYPHEMTVHTLTLVKVKEIQEVVRDKGYHAVPARLLVL